MGIIAEYYEIRYEFRLNSECVASEDFIRNIPTHSFFSGKTNCFCCCHSQSIGARGTRSAALCGKLPPTLCTYKTYLNQCYCEHILMPSKFALDLVISNSTSTHLVWFQSDQWYRKYRTDKHSVNLWTFDVVLPMNTAIQSFHKTLIYYHVLQLKCGCKKDSSSEDKVETVIFWQ